MSFREMHRPGQPLLLPNAWDFASGAAFADAGFAAVGTTSLGVAAAHGLPDGEGQGRDQTVALARLLRRLPCPVTVDIEGGYGDPVRTAQEVAAAGASGINLEDGRADGTLVPVAEQQEAIAAIKAAVPDLFVNARTDTYWLPAKRPGETAERLRAYADAGADGVFVPGADEDGIKAALDAVDLPLNVLFLPGRHTVAELAGLGVARISFGSLLFRTAVQAAVTTALAVADGGPGPAGVWPYAQVNDLATRYA